MDLGERHQRGWRGVQRGLIRLQIGTGTVGLSYLYYLGDQERWWVLALEYMPVFALLAWQWRSDRGKQYRGATGPAGNASQLPPN